MTPDAGRNESTVTLNDPDGSALSRVPVLQMSGNSYVPQQGHVVQLLQDREHDGGSGAPEPALRDCDVLTVGCAYRNGAPEIYESIGSAQLRSFA